MLKDVLANTPVYEIIGPRKINITGIALDPSHVKQGNIYIYSPNTTNISYHEAVELAIQKGATAICIGKEDKVIPKPITYLRTYNYVRFLSAASRNFYHNPSQNMKLVGVTGTHGKTTIGWMIKSILNVVEVPCAMLGTSVGQVGDHSYVSYEGEMNPIDMNSLLHKAVKEKVQWGLIECTYTGIIGERFRHVWFDSVIYTDLYTYFKNRKADYHYFEIRKTLIDHLKFINSPVIVNIDDFYTSELQHNLLVGYGLYGNCDVTAREIELYKYKSKFLLVTPKGNHKIILNVPGIHNIYNALAAAAWGIAHELKLTSIIQGLERFKGIPDINVETQLDKKITVEFAAPAGVSELEKIYDSLSNIPKDKLATILCLSDNMDNETFSSLKSLILQHSEFCTITCDYLSSVANMERNIPLFLKELESVGAKYNLDHYKALQKMIAELKDGGHILIVTGELYNKSGKE